MVERLFLLKYIIKLQTNNLPTVPSPRVNDFKIRNRTRLFYYVTLKWRRFGGSWKTHQSVQSYNSITIIFKYFNWPIQMSSIVTRSNYEDQVIVLSRFTKGLMDDYLFCQLLISEIYGM